MPGAAAEYAAESADVGIACVWPHRHLGRGQLLSRCREDVRELPGVNLAGARDVERPKSRQNLLLAGRAIGTCTDRQGKGGMRTRGIGERGSLGRGE